MRGMQAAVATLSVLLVGAIAAAIAFALMPIGKKKSAMPIGMVTISQTGMKNTSKALITPVDSTVAAPAAPASLKRVGAATMLAFANDGTSMFLSSNMGGKVPGTPTAVAIYKAAGGYSMYVPGAGWSQPMSSTGFTSDASKAAVISITPVTTA